MIGLVGTTAVAGTQAAPVRVEIIGEPGSYQLLRGGKPYRVKGAGTQVVERLESVRRHGGNSVRTWDTHDKQLLLDTAHELGLTVSLCLNVMRERHGFDYDDPVAVQQQLETMRQEVLKYRDHPALLTWIIGNELNMEYSNPKVYDAVNDISRMIHELDPNHPTTTATAGIDQSLAEVILTRAPDLDFLSIQVYGGLFTLPDTLNEIGLKLPIMVTEWGTKGHWEVDTTTWGAPIALTSYEKAMTYQQGHEHVLANMEGSLIGNYVFLWGHKLERTPTWYGMFTPDGMRTEAVDVMQQIWTGRQPVNPAPTLDGMMLDGADAMSNIFLSPDQDYPAEVTATDQDVMSFKWQLFRESEADQVGGDKEKRPEEFSHLIKDPTARSIVFTSPAEEGAFRLFVYVYDGKGGAAHANIPFYVSAVPHVVGDI